MISRYEVMGELGSGGMGNVFLARDPYMKREVAIKVLPYQFASQELFKEYFQREAEIIASLEHPSIVPVYDYGMHGNQPFIVMRYMAGGSLQDRLESTPMKPRQLPEIIEPIAEGLDAAHSQNIIHRDVKPPNILFDASNKAQLADFGLAKSFEQSTGKTVGMFIGTPAYMSPEQVRNEHLDGRSDIYALGVVLYCALAGEVPYNKGSVLATATAHVTDPIPSILDIRPDLEPSWAEVIAKAMAKKRQERYAKAMDLARDVSELSSGRWFFRKLIDD
jgi:serine/threonine protein kinase